MIFLNEKIDKVKDLLPGCRRLLRFLHMLVEAFEEQKSLYENEKVSRNRKISALEAEVQRLKKENRRLLSLEDRIKAIETLQIAQAAQAATAARK